MTKTPWLGGVGTPRAVCVLAPNASPMTLEGTNTWILLEPGSRRAVVIDPGPDDPRHLAAVLRAVEEAEAVVGLTLLTHGHSDHAGGARAFAAATGSAVRACDPRHVHGSEGVVDGDVIEIDGLQIVVVATPGHSGDSMSFHLVADSALLTGDTILGRGTTMVAHPDGRLVDYLSSLRTLQRLIGESSIDVVLPGHGPVVASPADAVAYYAQHRYERLDQVRRALDAISSPVSASELGSSGGESTKDDLIRDGLIRDGLIRDGLIRDGLIRDGLIRDGLIKDIVAMVYADIPPELWPAAELSVAAQLEYLNAESGLKSQKWPKRGQ